MAVIKNPVLTGFNSDPSILLVDADYYIACGGYITHPARPNLSYTLKTVM